MNSCLGLIEKSIIFLYFCLPLQIKFVAGGGASILNLATLLLFFSIFISGARGGKLGTKSWNFVVLITILIAWQALSVLWSVVPNKSLYTVVTRMLPHLITTYILLRYISNALLIQKIFNFYILGACLNALLSLTFFDYSVNSDDLVSENMARNSMWGADPNELASLFCMAVAYCFYFISSNLECRSLRCKYWTAIGILSIAIFTTGSRTGLIILLVLYCYNFIFNKRLSRLFCMLIFSLGVIFAVSFLPARTIERLTETTQQLEDKNLTGRGEIWKAGLTELSDNHTFIEGEGFRAYTSITARKLYWCRSFGGVGGHSTYISSFVETGVVGLIILFFIVLHMFNSVCVASISQKNRVLLSFMFPLVIAMFTLDIITQRWIFLFGALYTKLVEAKE